MKIISIRHPANHRDFYAAYPGHHTFDVEGPYEAAGFKPDETVLLIHGFNNDPQRAFEVYAQIGHTLTACKGKKKLRVMGLSWPSDGSVFRYKSDYRDALESGRKLGHIFDKMLADRAAPVSIVAHSMGTVVAMKALEACPGMVKRAYFMGGDLTVKALNAAPDFLRGKVRNIYSRDDKIVGVLAKILRPGTRIGEGPAPSVVNWDAPLLAGRDIHHNDYKDEPKIWAFLRKDLEGLK